MPASATRFDSFVALATRLVSKNGRALTINGRSTADFKDPAQPWLGKETATVSTPADGVFVTAKELRDLVRNLEISDTFGNVARDSSGILIAAEGLGGIRISSQDTVTDTHLSAIWSIRNVEVIEPGAVPILWILEVGK